MVVSVQWGDSIANWWDILGGATCESLAIVQPWRMQFSWRVEIRRFGEVGCDIAMAGFVREGARVGLFPVQNLKVQLVVS